MKGRPRTPTNVLEARGSFKHNPGRKVERKFEPKDLGPLGDPPDTLTPEERSAWNEVVGVCPPGLLTELDRFALEDFVRLLLEARDRTRPMRCESRSRFHSLLSHFGMT